MQTEAEAEVEAEVEVKHEVIVPRRRGVDGEPASWAHKHELLVSGAKC
jgi:hypothetical protein